MAISLRGKQVILAGSADFGVAPAPRLTLQARRVLRCPTCKSPLEIEIGADLEAESGHSVSVAMQIYDPAGDFRAVARGGATVLVTNRHLGASAPASRQCAGGYYVGSSPQALYGTLWHWTTESVTARGALGDERRLVLREMEVAQREGRAPEVQFPPGVERLFTQHELSGRRPVEPMRVLGVIDLPCVRVVPGARPEDGVAYLVDRGVFAREFSSPYAPELLVARLGGIGELRGPSLSIPANGLEIRDLPEARPRPRPRIEPEVSATPVAEVSRPDEQDVAPEKKKRTRAASKKKKKGEGDSSGYVVNRGSGLARYTGPPMAEQISFF